MATLSFLGLQNLALQPVGADAWLVLPPATSSGLTYWQKGSIRIQKLAAGGFGLDASSALLQLDGLQVALSTSGNVLFVQRDAAGNFRPLGGPSSLMIRLGSKGFAIGTVLIPAAPQAISVAFEASGSSEGCIRTKYDFLTGANEDEPVIPLSLRLKENAFFSFDLEQRQLKFGIDTIECVVSAGSLAGATSSPYRALFSNNIPITLTFAAIKTLIDRDLPWSPTLALKQGLLPLNSRLSGKGKPAIEASDCAITLYLQQRRKPNPGAGSAAGALLTALELHPLAPRPIALRINGLRDTFNTPENWSTEDTLQLGLRNPGADGQRSSSLLLLPTDALATRSAELTRSPRPAAGQFVHGWFDSACFALDKNSNATLRCDTTAAQVDPTRVPHIDDRLCYLTSRPWLQLRQARFHHGRPGNAYRSGQLAWRFESTTGVSGGLPLLSKGGWEEGDATPLRAANTALNLAFQTMELGAATAVHESGVAQTKITRTRILEVVPLDRGNIPLLKLSASQHDFEITAPALPAPRIALNLPRVAPPALRIQNQVPEGGQLDYSVYWPDLAGYYTANPPVLIATIDDWTVAMQGPIDPLAPLSIGDVADLHNRVSPLPVAVLKLGRQLNLSDLMNDMATRIRDTTRRKAFTDAWNGLLPLIRSVDPSLLQSDWVGLLLFDAPVDYDQFVELKALVPSEGDTVPRLRFLSVAPREPGSNSDTVSMSGAIDWVNPDAAAPVPTTPGSQQEASLVARSLKVAFKDRRIVQFEAHALLRFHSFLGISNGQVSTVDIVGSGRRLRNNTNSGQEAYEIRFIAEIAEQDRLVIFPLNNKPADSSPAFVKKVWLRRVEITSAPGQTAGAPRVSEIQIDGAIEFGKPDITLPEGLQNFFQKLNNVSFTNLRIDLAGLAGGLPRMLKLNYPSLSFNLDFPHVGLLGDALKLKFNRLAIDWNGPDLDFGHLPQIGGLGGSFDMQAPKLAFFGKIDFGSLPDMFKRSLSGFSLEGVFAINFRNGVPFGGPYIGIGGFGFDGLNFDLLSFLVIKADQLSLGPRKWKKKPSAPPQAPAPSGAALGLTGLSVTVLGHPVLPKGTGGFFSLEQDGGEGFWAILEGYSPPNSIFNIDWAFAAHNIDFSTGVARELLTPPPLREQRLSGDFSGLHQALADAWSGSGQGDDKDAITLYPATDVGGRGWTFAASLQAFNGAFFGRALIQDGGFTGMALYGDLFKRLFNWDFVFIGLYRHNITPGEDYFYFSVTLPAFAIGTINFMGGEIAAEFYTSGDFMVDIGFPWPGTDGGRRWERTLGAIITPGQASGGFYIRKREQKLDTGGKRITIAGGFALQWGLGASFGGGIFIVWVRIGVYVILEGELEFQITAKNFELTAFKLHGAAGVLAEGYGALDWWIISVRVSVRASAEIRASLIWSQGAKLVMPIEAELYVSARAEACIGGGCVRICRGISVSLSLPVRYQLEFG